MRMIDLKYQNNNQSNGITLREIDKSENLKILSKNIYYDVEDEKYSYQSLNYEDTRIDFDMVHLYS